MILKNFLLTVFFFTLVNISSAQYNLFQYKVNNQYQDKLGYVYSVYVDSLKISGTDTTFYPFKLQMKSEGAYGPNPLATPPGYYDRSTSFMGDSIRKTEGVYIICSPIGNYKI